MPSKPSKSIKNANKALSPSDSSEETTAVMREVVSSKTMSSAVATPSSQLTQEDPFGSETGEIQHPTKRRPRDSAVTRDTSQLEDGSLMQRSIRKKLRVLPEEIYGSDSETDRALTRDMVQDEIREAVKEKKLSFPTHLAVNQTYITLDKVITPELAEKFLHQAKLPGFSDSITDISMVMYDARSSSLGASST